LDLLAPFVYILLFTLKYSAIADLHNFQFTIAQTLGLSVFNSRLLAMDLNTETVTSTHSEVFFYLIFSHSGTSELKIPPDSLLLQALCTNPTENTVSIAADVTAYREVCLLSRCLEMGFITPFFHCYSVR
jgi:hypothetical protein